MPLLSHLVEELARRGLAPDQVCISGQVYDDIIANAREAKECPLPQEG